MFWSFNKDKIKNEYLKNSKNHISDYAKISHGSFKEISKNLLEGDFLKAMETYGDHLEKKNELLKKTFEANIKAAEKRPRAIKKISENFQKSHTEMVKIFSKAHQNNVEDSSLMSKMAPISYATLALGALVASSLGGKKAEADNIHTQDIHDVIAHENHLVKASGMEDHFLSQDIKDQIRLIMKEQMRLLLGEKSKNLEEATSYAETLIQKELEEDEASEADLPNALKTSSDPTESTFLTALKAGKEGLKPVPDPYAQILVAENLSVEALKPQITTNYIDTLKELKQKFAQSIDNSQLKDVKSLNEISDQVLKTPTGAFLKYAFNGEKDLEKALDHAVSTMLSKIKKDEKSKNRIASDTITDAIKTNYRGLKKEIIDLCRQVLINSVAHDDYYVLYHGHGNGLRLYVDMLREIKSYNDPYKLDRYIREI